MLSSVEKASDHRGTAPARTSPPRRRALNPLAMARMGQRYLNSLRLWGFAPMDPELRRAVQAQPRTKHYKELRDRATDDYPG
jgi:hypothetical protein